LTGVSLEARQPWYSLRSQATNYCWFSATSGSEPKQTTLYEKKAVEEAFAKSVLYGFEIKRQEGKENTSLIFPASYLQMLMELQSDWQN